MKLGWIVAAAFAMTAPALAQKAPPVPELLKRALSSPESKQLYSYDFEEFMEGGSARENGRQTIRGHIDPSRRKGDRVTIISAERTGANPDLDLNYLDKTYEDQADGDIFCDSISKDDVTSVTDRGPSPYGRLFTFTPKAEDDETGEAKTLMKKMSADVAIDEATGTLRYFTATLPKKFNVMLLGEVSTARIKLDCLPAANGRAYRARVEREMTASAFGTTYTTHSIETLTNLAPAS